MYSCKIDPLLDDLPLDRSMFERFFDFVKLGLDVILKEYWDMW
jgi:hypothetical protein